MINSMGHTLEDGREVSVRYDYRSGEPATYYDPGISPEAEVYSIIHENEEIIDTLNNEKLEQIETYILENIE